MRPVAAKVFGAVDLGASTGRVMAGVVENGRVDLHPVHRFRNGMTERDGHLRWDIEALYAEVLTGLARLAAEFPQVASIGIDTWAVDYGLLDVDGKLLAQPIAYRDARTIRVIERVHAKISPAALYDVNGLQFLPFNTLYQLEAEKASPLWRQTAHVVLLPDLLTHWLTGQLRAEVTNASTTGLLDARTRQWSSHLLKVLDIPQHLFPPLQQPGDIVGPITPAVAEATGLPSSTVVTAVGSHDTASAVVAVPATNDSFAYVSSGTWSLVGLELDAPVLSEESRLANLTNEGGVDGRTRYLRNVGGLWLLQESMRTWRRTHPGLELAALLDDAATLPAGGPTIDVNDQAFIAPGDMPARIAAVCESSAQRPPLQPVETVRCILDSLASSYAKTVARAAELTGMEPKVIHIVGGGSQNSLLCQLTANLSGLPVTAGPIEATSLGNVLVQARTHGAAPRSLEEMRTRLAEDPAIQRYVPS